MDDFHLLVSAEGLLSTAIILLYLLGGLAAHRLLLARLPGAYRQFAIAMLWAQMLILALSLHLQLPTRFDRWVWDVEGEWNIPATVSATLLASSGILALITTRLARSRPRWQRAYFLGIGLLFLYLALDEYLSLHEYFLSLETAYYIVGAVIAVVTFALALVGSKREAIWHIGFLVGLSMIGLGGLALDKVGPICDGLGPIRLKGCGILYPVEEALEYFGAWLVLAAILCSLSSAAPKPGLRARRALFALPLLTVAFLFLYSLFPRLELRLLAAPASVEFESGVSMLGYRLDQGSESTQIRIYTSAKQAAYMGAGYSVHLVDQVTGQSVARADEWAGRHHGYWLFGPDYEPVFLQWLDVAHGDETPRNRALWVALSLWRRHRDGTFHDQPVLAGDQRLLNASQVLVDEIILPVSSTLANTEVLAMLSSGFALVDAELPARATAGERLAITFTWRSALAGNEDHIQFLHFFHEESGEWWVYDQQPLGDRLPTRLWYSGLVDSETWQVPLPADLAPGRYNVFTGLYRLSDKERIPATDAAGNPFLDARIPLGDIEIR